MSRVEEISIILLVVIFAPLVVPMFLCMVVGEKLKSEFRD